MPITYTRVRDGRPATEAEALDAAGAVRDGFSIRRVLAPGEYASFDRMMFDAHRVAHTSADTAALLTDAAGKPVQLIDAATGAPAALTLNADVIAAIEKEAARLGLSVKRYIGEVLGYVTAHGNLTKSEGHE